MTAGTFIVMYLPQPILPVLGREFAVSPAIASLAVSLLIFGLAGASLVVGPLSDRYGRRTSLLVAGVALSATTIACAWAPTFSALLALRLTQGWAVPGITASTISYLSEEYPTSRTATLLGGYIAATVFGGLLSRLISGGLTTWFGWRWAFIFSGLLLLALVAFVRAFVAPSRNFRPTVDVRGAYRGMLAHLRRREMIGISLAGACLFFAFLGQFTYIPYHLERAPYELSPLHTGLVFLVYSAGIVSSPLSGAITRRLGARGAIGAGTVVAAVGMAGTLSPALPILIAALLTFCFGYFVAQSAATTYVATRAERERGSATAVYLAAYYLGGSLGATLPGTMWHLWGWPGILKVGFATIIGAAALVAAMCR